VIDGTNRFLVPGLTDMHVHLPGPAAPAGRAEDELFRYCERCDDRSKPEDGEREARQQKARGYDLVKILPGTSTATSCS
jgi:hypothetical protein